MHCIRPTKLKTRFEKAAVRLLVPKDIIRPEVSVSAKHRLINTVKNDVKFT